MTNDAHKPEGRDGEGFTSRIATASGKSEEVVIDVLWAIEEECDVSITHIISGARMVSESKVDEMRALIQKFEKSLCLLIAYQGKQGARARDLRASTRVMALELGFRDAAGADNMTDLARLVKLKKQTITKMSDVLQNKVELPPRPEQRDEKARGAMRQAANERVRKQNENK